MYNGVINKFLTACSLSLKGTLFLISSPLYHQRLTLAREKFILGLSSWLLTLEAEYFAPHDLYLQLEQV